MTSNFDKQFNYYLNLYENVPEEFVNFGHFGIESWHDMVNEGLIHTYPKKTLIKFLKEFGLTVVPTDYSSNDNYQHEITKTIDAKIAKKSVKNIEEYFEKLKNELFPYGYNIGRIIQDFSHYKFIIEPKFPKEVSLSINSNIPFFHITYKYLLPKIEKIGLTPRDSNTIFTHPGGRIYLIQTSDISNIQFLKYPLSIGRENKIKKSDVNYPAKFLDQIKVDNMIVLKIDVDGLKLFEDPMFPSKKGTFNACFTTQNIHPSNIKKTDY
jgi:hypothetical protein